MKATASILRLILQPLTIGVIVALLVRATLLQAYSIPSSSMSPTLEPGDHILVTPFGDAGRGDVVVFRNANVGPGFFVKRVVAVAGDHLEIRGGELRVNGRPVREAYLTEGTATSGRVEDLVPAGHVFVLGDHRSDSIDSRTWGFLPESQIVGRARVIFWSAGRVGGSSASAWSREDAPPAGGPRWNRVLRPIR